MVTGASRGLGRAMAHALADEGMHVSICARTRDTLNEAVAALIADRASAMGFVGDMTKPDDAQKWVDETVAEIRRHRRAGQQCRRGAAGRARGTARVGVAGAIRSESVRAGAAGAAVRGRTWRSAAAARLSISDRSTGASRADR